jgi:hypothetical protein
MFVDPGTMRSDHDVAHRRRQIARDPNAELLVDPLPEVEHWRMPPSPDELGKGMKVHERV